MKILYTLGNFASSAHQVILYTMNTENIAKENFQIVAEKCFDEALQSKNRIFMKQQDDMNAQLPSVSDVIWVQTTGNQWIAVGLWQKTPDSDIDVDGFRKVLKSVGKKAVELKQPIVSMPLLTLNEDLDLWDELYPVIEEELGAFNIQVIVHIPTEEQIIAVLDRIGGEIQSYTVKPKVMIRFA
jgi:hypothetical protein